MARGRKKQYPVPAWANELLTKHFATMDVTERLTVAEELEKKAAELREFVPKKTERTLENAAHLRLTPGQAEAVIYYYDRVCGKDASKTGREIKINVGARWILDSALGMLPTIAKANDAFCRYRDSEGIPDSALNEAYARRSLDAFRKEIEVEED